MGFSGGDLNHEQVCRGYLNSRVNRINNSLLRFF